MRPQAIHQFHSGAAQGDGVTNGMFFIQRILRESGYRSEIYCTHFDVRLSGRIRSFSTYENRPDELLLVHYSLGTKHDAWITELKSPLILVYHNITFAHFFPQGHDLRQFIEAGRQQLKLWGKTRRFVGAIADSTFNAEELLNWRYDHVAPIELLVDLDRLRQHPWNPSVVEEVAGARNLLFVGRFCEHKGQLSLVRMLRELVGIVDVPVRLLLVGGTTTPAYEEAVRHEIARLDLEDRVRILGKRDDADVYALYRAADLYVSLSEHEGFGMPLVEAMAFDLPILAYCAGNVAATLGSGGLLLDVRESDKVAAAAKTILQEPSLRRRIVEGQRSSLTRYERPVLVEALENYLQTIGFDVTLDKIARTMPSGRGVWSIEGPFDSSYSLAIVNRELARGLVRTGKTMALISRDGPGPFCPDEAFLARNADISAMTGRHAAGISFDVVLRNQYPPYVADMRGKLRLLANYAWEESGFPAEWATEFNCSLDLITVTSRYVAKVLRDNGVYTPIYVVGNGVDQALAQISNDVPSPDPAFCFLHISSCFPRKGVDVLLDAWARAFSKADPVQLVIKTFPNPHNSVETDLRDFAATHPDHAPISLIMQDLDAAALSKLYAKADAIVCPTRGEGFGLPLAEALALGKSVITTAYGGQSDFCTTDTAWLCDYSFSPAETHLNLFDSVWIEPDVDSLASALRDCRAADQTERDRRAQAGRDLMLSQYRWDHVAARTLAAVDAVRGLSTETLDLPKIGWVSTWNSRCGIAAYSRSLVSEIEPERLVVLANRTADLLDADETFVRRCWMQGWDDPLDELFHEICVSDISAVIIQFNFGFFHLPALARLIERLKDDGVLVFICLHSTMDVATPDVTIRLGDIKDALATIDRILVHSVHDLNRMKKLGLVENVMLFPMGASAPFSGDPGRIRAQLGLTGKTIIATFGYLLPNKGLHELVQACALLRKDIPDLHLLMLNALYPVSTSEAELRALQAKIKDVELGEDVTLVTDFLHEAEAIERLAAADVVIYPYQHTQESASAAVKFGIASLTPVACTPLPIFADIEGVSHRLPGISPEALAHGMHELLSNKRRLAELRDRQSAWVAAHDWRVLSRRLAGLVRGCHKPDFLA